MNDPTDTSPKASPGGPPRRGGAFASLGRLYTGAAVLLVNTVVLFVLLNVAVGFWLKRRDAGRAQVEGLIENHPEYLKKVYPEWSQDDVRAMFREMARPFELVAYTMFMERPVKGRFVNVSDQRFRLVKNQGPWPPSPEFTNIFFFGGSTGFGYLVTDEETIPSQLQEVLDGEITRPVRVYNFGQGSFYSTQERIFFEQMLAAGHVPDIAVFFDGLNDFQRMNDQPRYLDKVRQVYDNVTGLRKDMEVQLPLIQRLPLYRLATEGKPAVDWMAERGPAVAERMPEPATMETEASKPFLLTEKDREYFNHPPTVREMVETYLANKRLIEAAAEAHGVRAVFVLQPIPAYNFDFRDYFPGSIGCRMFSYYGYPELKRRLDAGEIGGLFLWAADLQSTHDGPVYVDGTHYTAPMSRRLAEAIGGYIIEKSLLAAPGGAKNSGPVSANSGAPDG